MSENLFNGLFQSALPNPTSNHLPILLDDGGIKKGKTPFIFENMWLKVERLTCECVLALQDIHFQGKKLNEAPAPIGYH